MSSHLTKAKQEKVERDLLKNERALKLRVKALEDNEVNLLGIIELRDTEIEDIKSDYRKVNKENQELKEDNHFKDDQIEHDNNYQDELIKCNDSSCNRRHSAVVLNWVLIGVILLIITGALLR